MLLADHAGQSFVEDSSWGAQSASHWHHQGCERAMLNVGDLLLRLPSLLLILFVGGLDGLVSMGQCRWVEHIKECTLPLISSESKAFTFLVLHCLPSLWFGVGKFLRIGVEVVVQPQHLGTLWWEIRLSSRGCDCARLLEMLLCGSWRHVWCWIEHHMSSGLGALVGSNHFECTKHLKTPACARRIRVLWWVVWWTR